MFFNIYNSCIDPFILSSSRLKLFQANIFFIHFPFFCRFFNIWTTNITKFWKVHWKNDKNIHSENVWPVTGSIDWFASSSSSLCTCHGSPCNWNVDMVSSCFTSLSFRGSFENKFRFGRFQNSKEVSCPEDVSCSHHMNRYEISTFSCWSAAHAVLISKLRFKWQQNFLSFLPGLFLALLNQDMLLVATRIWCYKLSLIRWIGIGFSFLVIHFEYLSTHEPSVCLHGQWIEKPRQAPHPWWRGVDGKRLSK